MATLFSNVLLTKIANLRTAQSSRILSGAFCDYGMRYSTTVPNHPDSHENFQPKDNDKSFVESRKYDVDKDVKENPIMLYMNGTPRCPKCKFSLRTLVVLKQYQVKFAAKNVLGCPELKEAVREYSGYLTFPQIFIKGEFIRGTHVLQKMDQNGELKQKIQDLEESYSEESDSEESD